MPSKTDIWMPLYIGDYLADTSHLDAERSGAYLHLLMHYWRKGPLSNDTTALLSISKLRSSDAPSILQALLGEFFSMNGDGMWHQKRQDAEIMKAQDKSMKAKEKAKTAAGVRWGKDAPSNASSNAPSTPQAMLEQCPLPLPSQLNKEQVQKPSRGKRERATKTAIADERHTAFKEAIGRYWDSKNKGFQMPWGPAEGKQLGMFLREAPQITLEQFTVMLRNRYKSNVNHGDRPSQWIFYISSYGPAAMDRFNKPIEEDGNGTNHQGSTRKGVTGQRVHDARLALAEAALARGYYTVDDALRSVDMPVSGAGPDGRDSSVHGGLRSADPEVLDREG